MYTKMTNNPENEKNERGFSSPIHLVRIVALVLVVLLHASNEYYGAVIKSPLETNFYLWTTTIYKSIALPCVPLFIMLSGALLLQPSKINEPIRVFLKKRLSRIGLAFAFWGGIYIAWAFFLSGTPVTLGNVAQAIVKSLLTNPYYHFWFLYVIAGLYLITPILRAIIGYGERKILRYLILLWFAGVAVIPIVNSLAGFNLNGNVFTIGGWIGYFALGTYLQGAKVRASILYLFFSLGLAWTVLSTWIMNFTLQSTTRYNFFIDDLAPNVIIASVALFLILGKFRADWPGRQHPRINKVAHAISTNTLPIYLFHVIILESLQKGFFGFKLSLTVMNPIIEIPLITAATFLITLGLVLLMKKVPILRRLIG